MKKILLLFVFILMIAANYAQVVTLDGVYATIWQDSLYTTSGDTSAIINMGMNYRHIYIVGTDTSSTQVDTTKIQSGTINYVVGYDKAGNLQYVPHDTVWAYFELDTVNTSNIVCKVSNQIIFPYGTNEYYSQNYSVQLLKIILTNKNNSKLYYKVRAVKYPSY